MTAPHAPRRGSRSGVILFLLALTTCRAAPPLVVASDLDNPPFAYVDEAGQPAGRDVEMMQLLAEEIERPLAWRRMPFDRLLDGLSRGEADVVCATLGVTPERLEHVLFSAPYYRTAIAVVARTSAGAPRTLNDLAGRRVAAGRGTTSERAVRRRLGHAIGVFDAKADLSTADRLRAGEIDAAVMDLPAAEKLVHASNGEFRVLAPDLESEDYALALPLTATTLRDDLNRALTRLRERGRLEQLDRRFGLAASRSTPGPPIISP